VSGSGNKSKVVRLLELPHGKALSLRVRAVVGITVLISLAFTFAFAFTQMTVEFALGLACIGVHVSSVISTPVPDSHADPTELLLALLARRVEACLVLFNAT
jgi:hypothetical protein